MRNLIISLVAVIMITGVGKVLAEPRPPVLLGEKYTVKYFDFEDINQLSSLTRWGDDPSLLENGYLRCPVGSGLYKGLGKKLFFIEGDETPSIQNLSNRNNERPISATMEFDLWLDETFQKNGADNEAGKFSGFEGIYDQAPDILENLGKMMPNDHFEILGETYKSLGEYWTDRKDGVQILLPPGGGNGAAPEIHQCTLGLNIRLIMQEYFQCKSYYR